MRYLAIAAPLLLAAVACADRSGSPVERVVKLLTEMKEGLAHDERTEQFAYDKYACWCTKTTKKKAEAIETARDELKSLGQEIRKFKGTISKLTSEVKQLLDDMADNEKEQATSTKIRQKENAAYLAEKAEMTQCTSALERAIMMLKDQGGSSLLQTQSAAQEASKRLLGVVAALPAKALAGSGKLAAVVDPAKLALVNKAAEDLKTGDKGKYTPAAMSIVGILESMYDTFSADLEKKDKAEATTNKDYTELIEAKGKELSEMQESVHKKHKKKSEAEVMLAEAVQTYDDTEAQMKSDIEFFDATKDSCETKNEEWVERSKLRKQEIEGVEKALEILSSDEAREMFDKAIKPGNQGGATFLQVSAVTESMAVPVKKAYETLKEHASKAHSLRLARIAAKVGQAQAGHFDEVLGAIDDVIKVLDDEQKDDEKKRDQCKDEYQQTSRELGDLTWKIEVNNAKIEKLEAVIEKKNVERDETIVAIEDVTQEISDMKEQRASEKEAYEQAKKEDESAIDLLGQAKDALTAFYEEQGIELGELEGVALNQEEPFFEKGEADAPHAEFSDKSKAKNQAKSIVSLMTMLVEDLEGEVRQATAAEEKAIADFEVALEAAEKLKSDLEEKKTNLEEFIAERETEKTEEEDLLKENEDNHTEVTDYKKKITPDCDWIMGAFDGRAAKRATERDGLVQAKDFLHGVQVAKEQALEGFLQKKGAKKHSFI